MNSTANFVFFFNRFIITPPKDQPAEVIWVISSDIDGVGELESPSNDAANNPTLTESLHYFNEPLLCMIVPMILVLVLLYLVIRREYSSDYTLLPNSDSEH